MSDERFYQLVQVGIVVLAIAFLAFGIVGGIACWHALPGSWLVKLRVCWR